MHPRFALALVPFLPLVFSAPAPELKIDLTSALHDKEGHVVQNGTAVVPPGTSRSITATIVTTGTCPTTPRSTIEENPDAPQTGAEPFLQYWAVWLWSEPPNGSRGCALDNNGEKWGTAFQAIVVRFNGFAGEVTSNLTFYSVDGWYDQRDTVSSFGLHDGRVVLPTNSFPGEYVDIVATEFPSSAFKKLSLVADVPKIDGLPAYTAGSSSLTACYYDNEQCWATLSYAGAKVDTLVFLLGTARETDLRANVGITSRFSVVQATPTPTPSPTAVPRSTSPPTSTPAAAPSADASPSPSEIPSGSSKLNTETKIFIGFGAIGAVAAIMGVAFGIYETRSRMRQRAQESGTSSESPPPTEDVGFDLYDAVPDTHGI